MYIIYIRTKIRCLFYLRRLQTNLLSDISKLGPMGNQYHHIMIGSKSGGKYRREQSPASDMIETCFFFASVSFTHCAYSRASHISFRRYSSSTAHYDCLTRYREYLVALSQYPPWASCGSISYCASMSMALSLAMGRCFIPYYTPTFLFFVHSIILV